MNRMSKLFLIDCSKAAECCHKAQYKEANKWEKLKLKLHLFFCAACRKFSSRNVKLTETIKKSKIQSCPPEQKKKWKDTIHREYVKDNV